MVRLIAAAAVAVASVGLLAAVPPAATAVTALCASHSFGPASRPFAPAQQVASIEAARRRIDFTPRLLAGQPFRVFVSREAEVRQRRVGITYRRNLNSWVTLTQQRATTSRARFDQFIRALSARYECGEARTLRLRNGSLALLLSARDRRVLRFRSTEIDLMLLGSPTSASQERLLALANVLA